MKKYPLDYEVRFSEYLKNKNWGDCLKENGPRKKSNIPQSSKGNSGSSEAPSEDYFGESEDPGVNSNSDKPTKPSKPKSESETSKTPTNPKPSSDKENKFDLEIQFIKNTDEFDFSEPTTQTNLEKLKEWYETSCTNLKTVLEGHASSEGNPNRNKILSDLRSKKIRQWLVEQGIEDNKIEGTVGYGSTRPKVKEPSLDELKKMNPDEIESQRRKNRRTTVKITKSC